MEGVDWGSNMCEKQKHERNTTRMSIRDAVNCNQTNTHDVTDVLWSVRRKDREFQAQTWWTSWQKDQTPIFPEFIQLWFGSVTDPQEI